MDEGAGVNCGSVPPGPATPDFYEYPWHRLSSAVIEGEFVALRWDDGTTLDAFGWWLRESVVAPDATDPVTRESTVDPSQLPEDLVPMEVSVSPDGALTATWSDGFNGSVHPGWLRHVADGVHKPAALLPDVESWTAASLTEPPTFRAAELAGDDGLRSWIRAMVQYGVARVEGLDASESVVLDLTTRIGCQRDTNFGLDWPVKAEISSNDQNSTANTALRLGNHTDLPTREVPPGFQFLHCVENTVAGGFSTMADGAALAEHLAANEPEVFDALTTLHWVWFNRSRDHDHRWSGPMLDYGAASSPLTVRAFYPLRAFPDMERADIPRAYRAARRFHQLAAEPVFQIRFPLQPGDLVGFDNRRILHGRESFDETGGLRYLRGTYVDHDEVHSRLRVLERHSSEVDRTHDPKDHR